MTRKPPVVIDSDGRLGPCSEDAPTYARELISELNGLDEPADERQFVEAVVRATRLDPVDTILITDSADADSRDPLSERVLLPSTGEPEQIETARRMFTVSDNRRGITLPQHEPHTRQSAEPATQQSTESRWGRFRERLTALW